MAPQADKMRITIRSRIRSYTFNRIQYMRGKVYVLANALAQQLLATGEFKVAILPPPDPRAKQRAKANELINTLAGLPGETLDRLIRLAEGEAQGAADAGAADAEEDEEPKPKKPPKGVITTDAVTPPADEPEPDPPKQPTQSRKAVAEDDKPRTKKKTKKTKSPRRPRKAEAETLADL